MATISETELYAPVKTFLEGQGYVVKSEVGAADVVATVSYTHLTLPTILLV